MGRQERRTFPDTDDDGICLSLARYEIVLAIKQPSRLFDMRYLELMNRPVPGHQRHNEYREDGKYEIKNVKANKVSYLLPGDSTATEITQWRQYWNLAKKRSSLSHQNKCSLPLRRRTI